MMALRTIAIPLLAAACAAAQAEAVDAVTLRDGLLRLAAERLGPQGLRLDEAAAQVGSSRPLEPSLAYDATPLWHGEPRLPLAFALAPRGVSGASGSPALRAYLSAPVMREVLVARGRLARGAVPGCADLAVDAKPLRVVPPQALRPPCALDGTQVLRRPLLAGEPLRVGDLGPPSAVIAEAPVAVRVVVGQVALEKSGVALVDGQLGDPVKVRVAGSAQPLQGRVIGERMVLLEDRP